MQNPADYKKMAEQIFTHSVEAVHPSQLIHQAVKLNANKLHIAGQQIDVETINHIYVVGAGKATAPMAEALEEIVGDFIKEGIILVKHGHTLPLRKIETIEAGHPVPDEPGVKGTQAMLQLLKKVTDKDLVIVLISGGGSSLLIDLPPDCSLRQLQECFQILLRSGATIVEMNAIRKHLSQVKGGQLAKLCYPAKLITLILSDVVGDPLDVIASGPTVADPSTFADAWQVIEKYKLHNQIPSAIRKHLEMGIQGIVPETPKPADPIFRSVSNFIIGSNTIALEAARQKATQLGFHTSILQANITGEAREVAAMLVKEARKVSADANYSKPACLLMGGETTVTVTGKGLGGRNQELVLVAALTLQAHENIVILSGGTDGSDGPTDAAGAIADGQTVIQALHSGVDAQTFLDANDSYYFFKKAGGHITTGPTLTNVMDVMVALIY
jgi:glycerate-2-kinase